MRLIDPEQLRALRKEYPAGSRVKLLHMDDPYAPPISTKGTVIGVDDIGSILVEWDNGSSLNVVFLEQTIARELTMNKIIREQILAIRDTGLTNMFDVHMVQRLVFERIFMNS